MGILQAGAVRRRWEGRFTFQDRVAIRPLFAGRSTCIDVVEAGHPCAGPQQETTERLLNWFQTGGGKLCEELSVVSCLRAVPASFLADMADRPRISSRHDAIANGTKPIMCGTSDSFRLLAIVCPRYDT